MQPTQNSITDQILSTPPEKKSRLKEALGTVLMLCGALLTAFILNIFVFQSYEVDGQSMQPTLHNADRLIILKAPRTLASITRNDYIPERGEIIVFHKPNGEPEQLIKRVIGLPGDRVVVKNEKITIYNDTNPDGFNPDEADYGKDLSPTYGNVDAEVGEGEVFVVGDNRIPGASLDSRSSLGNIPASAIVGKLILRYLPVSDYQTF